METDMWELNYPLSLTNIYLSVNLRLVIGYLNSRLCFFPSCFFPPLFHWVIFTLDRHDRRNHCSWPDLLQTHTQTHTHSGLKNNSWGGFCKGSDGVCPHHRSCYPAWSCYHKQQGASHGSSFKKTTILGKSWSCVFCDDGFEPCW